MINKEFDPKKGKIKSAQNFCNSKSSKRPLPCLLLPIFSEDKHKHVKILICNAWARAKGFCETFNCSPKCWRSWSLQRVDIMGKTLENSWIAESRAAVGKGWGSGHHLKIFKKYLYGKKYKI